MSKTDRTIEGQLIDESSWFEIGEICEQLHVERTWIVQLVDAGVLEPRGRAPEAWAFPATALIRARTTARLMRDLDVNLAGAALILDLIDERRNLQARLRQLEQLLES
jgi:chaperone modulatory protein CbpM